MRLSWTVTLALAALTLAVPASAQFNPGPNPITGTVGAETLSGGTGTINAGGVISVAGSTLALSMTGTSTLINNGTIQTSGSGRAIDSNSGVGNLTITNTGLISSVSSDAFRVNTNSQVTLTNSGTIQVTAGGQAIDWAAIASASNVLINQVTGIITAVGEDAARPGTGGVVTNAGTISATPTGTTTPSGSDGVQANGSGVVLTNTGTVAGRHGVTGGANGFAITVNNNSGLITGLNGSGINIDDLGSSTTVTNAFGATIRGGVLSGATSGDGDGVDADGILTLTNAGDILGYGARGLGSDGLPNNAEAVSVGGGSIINTATGRIIGSTSLADAPNGDPGRAGNGILADNSSGGNAVAATTITNAGLIQGKSGFGIKIIGTFADTVTNAATGTIIGGNGTAIDLGAGDDKLNVFGGTIVGNILGGDGFDTLTIAGDFSYGGSISSFGLVDIQSGLVSFSGLSTYTGITRVNGGQISFDDVNLLSFASSLDLSGGALSLTDALETFSIGQTFSSLSLSDNSALHLGFSLLNFGGLDTVTAGSLLTIDHNTGNSLGYALRFAGDLSLDTDFLSLLGGTTVNGFAAQYRVVNTSSGAFTDILATDPVPEPSTLVLVSLGAAILAWRGRRRAAKPR